jgi:hypothetical protein
MIATKVTTCCYCGSRAVLVLHGRQRHELGCATCGAPLREMKMLRTEVTSRAERPRAQAVSQQQPRHHPTPQRPRQSYEKPRKSKGLGRRILAKLWDEIEDIFD